MDYIRITEDNIDGEHICCAMSGKQSLVKKEWLRQRFAEELVFYRSRERGKCFIEYIPAEYAWLPIQAEGYLYINCLWVSGSMKGHGYSNDLLAECIRRRVARASPTILAAPFGDPVLPCRSRCPRTTGAEAEVLAVARSAFSPRTPEYPNEAPCFW